MSDIVERLNAVTGNTQAHQFEIISLIPRAAAEIDRLRQELAEARAKADEANHALVDKYRDPKSGMFNFPTDVGMIIRRLERERDEARAKAIEEAARVGYRECAETRHVKLGDAVAAAIRSIGKEPK